MFDSLDYFVRNRIKTVHFHAYGDNTPDEFKNISANFDKDKKTFNGRHFRLRDTIFVKQWYDPRDKQTHSQKYNDTIRYTFDKKGRLTSQFHVDQYGVGPSQITTTYLYTDDDSKRIKTIIKETTEYIDSTKYSYDKKYLIKRVNTLHRKRYSLKDSTIKGSSKNYLDYSSLPYNHYYSELHSNHDMTRCTFESESPTTVLYEYYQDGKLKKETRMYAMKFCENNLCKSYIDYKYDTD